MASDRDGCDAEFRILPRIIIRDNLVFDNRLASRSVLDYIGSLTERGSFRPTVNRRAKPLGGNTETDGGDA
jgi:hypothetical protein